MCFAMFNYIMFLCLSCVNYLRTSRADRILYNLWWIIRWFKYFGCGIFVFFPKFFLIRTLFWLGGQFNRETLVASGGNVVFFIILRNFTTFKIWVFPLGFGEEDWDSNFFTGFTLVPDFGSRVLVLNPFGVVPTHHQRLWCHMTIPFPPVFWKQNFIF